MTPGTQTIIGLALAALFLLLALLVGTAAVALRQDLSPAARSLLLLDLVVLACGHAGLSILLAGHLRQMLMHRVDAATEALRSQAEGRVEARLPEAGPRELAGLAQAVNANAEATERRLRRILQEAHGAAAASLLLGIAHEVRNPLAVARLVAQGLPSLPDSERTQAIHRLLRSLDRLEEVVQTLQEASRPTSSSDPNRVVRAALMAVQSEMLHLQAAQFDAGARQRAACDGATLMQALVALLRNAAEATPPLGLVHIRTRDEEDIVRIDIIDGGPGLAPELGDRVFEPFTTTKQGHVGLGLALARQAIEAQGGRLHLTGRPSLRATVRLPAGRPTR